MSVKETLTFTLFMSTYTELLYTYGNYHESMKVIKYKFHYEIYA